MNLAKKAGVLVIAGVTALSLTMPQAKARDGRNAALFGGLLLGAIAGAAIAGASESHHHGPRYYEDTDADYEYVRPRPRHVYRAPVYLYEEETIYVPRHYHRRYWD